VATFYVQNFGCRATQADGAALERQFEERGLQRAAKPSDAEIVVLNTCTVTASADQDARAAVRRVHRENPGARIVVTGCYAQRAPEELASLSGVAQVIGNSHKNQLVELALPESDAGRSPEVSASDEAEHARGSGGFVALASLTGQRPTTDDQGRVFVSDIFAHTELLAAPVFDAANQRTRPNLKVQDGCDNRCSFCVIPFVRGQSRSLPLARILGEVDTLVRAGFREVVISGINLGRWGRDLEGSARLSAVSAQLSEAPEPDALMEAAFTEMPGRRPETDNRRPRFEDLVRAILDHTSLEKLRISSVEPMDWSDELIALVAGSPRIAKHAHVPMQSGSDAVLRRMHRKYRPWHYRDKIEKIRGAMPDAAIGADVMVGFPGETDAEFEETRQIVEELPFTYLHVFTYSARPGTPAAGMAKQVPVQVARERNRILRELAAGKKQKFLESFVGRTVEAITLSKDASAAQEFTEALTDNYLSVLVPAKLEPNQWVQARVAHVLDGKLFGETDSAPANLHQASLRMPESAVAL
jgi:threonylcarbamoyladenosine tRNA methylthiotransferase MtaB